MAAGEKGMEQVECDGAMPDVEVHLVNRHVLLQRPPGAVHDHIQAPEPRNRGCNGAPHAFVLRDIGLDEEGLAARAPDVPLRGLPRGRIDFDDRDPGALPHVSHCGRFRYPGPGAGQERDFAVQSSHAFLLPVARCPDTSYPETPAWPSVGTSGSAGQAAISPSARPQWSGSLPEGCRRRPAAESALSRNFMTRSALRNRGATRSSC